MALTLVTDLDERSYHAHQALSSTQARLLLQSPAKYKWSLTHPQPPRDVFDIGTAVHSKVLGVGAKVAVLAFDDWRSKQARDARDAARSAGVVPVLEKDYLVVEAMAEAVLAHETARGILEANVLREASVFATCPETGVEMRARFDVLGDAAADLKTTVDASPQAWPRTVATYGYDVQASHYRHTYQFSAGHDVTDFTFIAVEKSAPHLVCVHGLSDYFREIGDAKAVDARRKLAACREFDEWPGYPSGVTYASPPNYYVYEFEDRSGGGEVHV